MKTQQKRFHAVDGDKGTITVKLNTCLNLSSSLIQSGLVLKMVECHPIYFNFYDYTDRRVMFLLSNFEVVALEPVAKELLQRPADEDRQVVNNRKQVVSKRKWNRDQSNLEEQSSVKDDTGVVRNECACAKLLDGTECVLETWPADSLAINQLAHDNPWAEREAHAMSLSQKRFLLYYWYATIVFHVIGPRNRVKLPDCILQAVRNRFPEADGNYKGHEDIYI